MKRKFTEKQLEIMRIVNSLPLDKLNFHYSKGNNMYQIKAVTHRHGTGEELKMTTEFITRQEAEEMFITLNDEYSKAMNEKTISDYIIELRDVTTIRFRIRQ